MRASPPHLEAMAQPTYVMYMQKVSGLSCSGASMQANGSRRMSVPALELPSSCVRDSSWTRICSSQIFRLVMARSPFNQPAGAPQSWTLSTAKTLLAVSLGSRVFGKLASQGVSCLDVGFTLHSATRDLIQSMFVPLLELRAYRRLDH